MKKTSIIQLYAIFCLALCLHSCGAYYGKVYEFSVENRLSERIVEIVPRSKTNFWLSPSESYIIPAGDQKIIGSKVVYDRDKKATDLFQSQDIIEPFDVVIDGTKQEKMFALRMYWNYSLGKAKNSGKYTLILDENILKD